MPVDIHKVRISKIVSRAVITVAPDTPAEEALSMMAEAKISCLVIAQKKKPIGIFTERDLVRTVHKNIPFKGQTIGALMTSPVKTIPGHLSVFEAYNLMLTNSIRHHVVVKQNGNIHGVMTQSDLINQLGLEYFVEMRKVEQVMSTRVSTIGPQQTLAQAISKMAEPRISCVVINDGNSPVGILTERDAVRLVAAGADSQDIRLDEVMTTPVITLPIGSTIHQATYLMKKHRIRRVLVVDHEDAIAGIVTQSDIVKGLEEKYISSLKELLREKEDLVEQTAHQLIDKTVYLDNILRSAIDMAIIATDIDLNIKYYNPVAERVFGYQSESVIGRSVQEFHNLAGVIPERLSRAREMVRRTNKYSFTVKIMADGEQRDLEGHLSGIIDRQQRLVGYLLMLHDITERLKQEEMIHHLAYHDALTGLPNRVLLSDRLAQSLAATERYSQRGVLMLLDLDRFKDVNDTLGHKVGDILLQEVSKRLISLLRKSDTVSRMGGDEFVLLMPNLPSPESAEKIAGKIVRALRNPFLCEGRELVLSASIGIAEFPADAMNEESLLKMADIALYRVKESGRDNFQFYSKPRDTKEAT